MEANGPTGKYAVKVSDSGAEVLLGMKKCPGSVPTIAKLKALAP